MKSQEWVGLRVTRVSGAKNTFFVVNTMAPPWSGIYPFWDEPLRQELVRYICRGFHDFQTDGLLFLHQAEGFDFAWDFYNSDGSSAEMCGNAARCAVAFFHSLTKSPNPYRFLTRAGAISGKVLSDGIVEICMTGIESARELEVLSNKGLFLNSGVPHFVLQKKPDEALAKKLRQVSDFGPLGSNITFVEDLSPGQVRATTFERGVEAFTQACGTGAVAAAAFLQIRQPGQTRVQVQMPGGVLEIENALVGCHPILRGAAQLEFDMEIR
jgi:diaminopimelate epimerase